MRKLKIEIEIRVQPHQVRALYRLFDEGDEVGAHFAFFEPEPIDQEVVPQLDGWEVHGYLNSKGKILIMSEPLQPQRLEAHIDQLMGSIKHRYESGGYRGAPDS